MKHTRNHVIKETIESRELHLYADNTRAVYEMVQFVAKNFARKMKRGQYDSAKAIDALYPVATEAAKMYCREFGGEYNRVFDVTCRYTVAAELAVTAEELALEALKEE